MTYNRNDLWRIKRSAKQLERALDSLSRAGGELRPKQFKPLRDLLDAITEKAEQLHRTMDTAGHEAAEEIAVDKAARKTLTLDLDDDEVKEAAE